MKKVLLINPEFNVVKENYDSSISVGLLSIATYLDILGVPVRIIDGVRQKDYLSLIRSVVKDYDIVGLSVMTMQIGKALEVNRLIREVNSNALIIWGGSHPTFFPEQTIKHPDIDIVCVGEGELTMADLATGKAVEEINGIYYKDRGAVKTNPVRELHNPNLMPLFRWELVPEEILHHLYLIPSLTSRGCPHRCTFCINAILKNRWRARSVEQVLEDLRIIKSKEYFKDKKLRFWDENFFVDINRAKAIIDGMIDKGLQIPWETTVRAGYIRPGMVDEELMAKLKESGCYLLSFGAESGSSTVLRMIKKDVTADEIYNSAKICLKYSIIPQYSFMIGLPGETKADMFDTLKLIDRLVALSDQVQILGPQAFRPYPGSELYAECIKAGWQEPQSLDDWKKVSENELSYMSVDNFPWVKDKDFVESMEAYVRFGAMSFKSAMNSTITSKKALKFLFICLCKFRWKLKFFYFPIEFKLAKKFVTK
ncbi:MAG: radical SAM protein [Candidatus Buchananbacteria bacterium]|jgi:magnesium-protoporphyrin IX monomethyl ester (oxidative) cyclase